MLSVAARYKVYIYIYILRNWEGNCSRRWPSGWPCIVRVKVHPVCLCVVTLELKKKEKKKKGETFNKGGKLDTWDRKRVIRCVMNINCCETCPFIRCETKR